MGIFLTIPVTQIVEMEKYTLCLMIVDLWFCGFLWPDLSAVASSVLLELPRLARYQSLHSTLHCHGGRLPGLHVCGYLNVPTTQDLVVYSETGTAGFPEGEMSS